MIRLTRLNGSEFVVNAAMIEFIEATPDTVLRLISGRKIIVTESVDTVMHEVRSFYRQVGLIGQSAISGSSDEEE